MTAYRQPDAHAWTITLGPDDEEYRRWQRRCSTCGDRVTAFRGTAIYQFGRDADATPHAVPLAGWQDYAECRAAAPALAVAEERAAYDDSRTNRRGLKPIPPARAVTQIIERTRYARDLTMEQLAEQLEIDPRTLYRWSAGDAQPGGYPLLRLVRLALTSRDPRAIRPMVRRQLPV